MITVQGISDTLFAKFQTAKINFENQIQALFDDQFESQRKSNVEIFSRTDF